MTVFIVDDEISAINTQKVYLTEFFPDLEILGYARSVKDATKKIKRFKPNLVLLDIELSDGTGFDILKSFPNPKFKVIFITAFDNFAVQAFRCSAVDYLLKPLSPIEFQDAIKKALESESASNQQLELLTLLHNLSPRSNNNKKIVLRTSDDIHLISTSELVRIESDGAYSHFILRSGKRVTVSQHLKHYDDILANHGFFRCHQSHMVNISFINRYHKADGGLLILIDGTSIPVSSRKRETVIKMIEQLGIH
jgi:two-component system LytT family response regulator